jgi:hypothetical protein
MPWSFSFGCIGTVPDDGKEEGWPAAVSSAENFAKFDLPPEANKPKSNFAKISVESYPFRGWPQKQAVLYKVGINGNGPGGTGGDARPGVLICCLFSSVLRHTRGCAFSYRSARDYLRHPSRMIVLQGARTIDVFVSAGVRRRWLRLGCAVQRVRSAASWMEASESS